MAVRETVRLSVVPSNRRREFVVRVEPDRPLYIGPGRTRYLCGGCGAVLCEGVHDGFVASLVFECPCGELNRVSSEDRCAVIGENSPQG
jgi:hypothetical protein